MDKKTVNLLFSIILLFLFSSCEFFQLFGGQEKEEEEIGEFEDITIFNKCIRFNDEARMIFPQDGEVNPFFTFGCHGFVWLTEGDAEGTMGVSLGGGIFYNPKGFFGKTSLYCRLRYGNRIVFF